MPIRCVGTWPVNATMGIESISASWSAVTRFVAAGPEVTRQTPDLARRARVAFGRMARRGLLPHEDVANALKVVEDVVDRQHRPAGQAEDESTPSFFKHSSRIRAPESFTT